MTEGLSPSQVLPWDGGCMLLGADGSVTGWWWMEQTSPYALPCVGWVEGAGIWG